MDGGAGTATGVESLTAAQQSMETAGRIRNVRSYCFHSALKALSWLVKRVRVESEREKSERSSMGSTVRQEEWKKKEEGEGKRKCRWFVERSVPTRFPHITSFTRIGRARTDGRGRDEEAEEAAGARNGPDGAESASVRT